MERERGFRLMAGRKFNGNRLAVALLAPAIAVVSLWALPAAAGDVTDQAAEAENLLAAGKADEAEAAFGKAFAAFWTASTLQFHVALFADSVAGFGKYQPRAADQPFKPGDNLLVYLEPINYGFTADGDLFRVALTADIEIRTPGGLTLAKAGDFGRMEWSGRAKTHEVHATISFPVPDLKPGDYQLLVTVHDQGSPKTATLTFPFAVAK